MGTPRRQIRTAEASLAGIRAQTRRRRPQTPANACPSCLPHRGCRARNALWSAWNGKREGSAGAIVQLHPKAAMMPLDDGPADEEPDTHAVAFRCVEGVKQLVHALGVDAYAGIAYPHAHTIAVLAFGSDQ